MTGLHIAVEVPSLHVAIKKTYRNHHQWLKYLLLEIKISPDQCGSVGWALSAKWKVTSWIPIRAHDLSGCIGTNWMLLSFFLLPFPSL